MAGNIDEESSLPGSLLGGPPPSPRFSCGGLAKINRLPSDGIFLQGKMLDLSLGGCRIATLRPIERGVRTELVVHVNSASFRAVGEVRAIRGESDTCIQFIYLSRGGKDMLTELVAELAKSQALMNQFRSSRRELEAEELRWKLENGRHVAEMWTDRSHCFGTPELTGIGSAKATPAGGDSSVGAERLVVPVRLFS
jgi:hypothetical protein